MKFVLTTKYNRKIKSVVIDLMTTTDAQVDEQTQPPNCNGTNDRSKETKLLEQLIAKPSYSLLASLMNTRELVTELREINNKNHGIEGTARVLTSTKSLPILIEKERKKKRKGNKS